MCRLVAEQTKTFIDPCFLTLSGPFFSRLFTVQSVPASANGQSKQSQLFLFSWLCRGNLLAQGILQFLRKLNPN